MMRSLYLPGWRQFHPWNWYCIITVISPYWPPISSCIRRASTGVGPFRLGLELQPLVVGVHAPLLWGSTLVAARLGGGRHPGVTPASPRPRGVEELPQPYLDGVADAAQVRGRGQGDGRVGEVAGLGQAGPEPAGGVALGPDTDDEDAGPLGAGVVAGRVHGPGRWPVAVTAASPQQRLDHPADGRRRLDGQLGGQQAPVQVVLADRLARVPFGQVGLDEGAVGALAQRLAGHRGQPGLHGRAEPAGLG